MKISKSVKRFISCILSFIILFTFSTNEYTRASNELPVQDIVQITTENDDDNIESVRMYNPQNKCEYFLSVEKITSQLNTKNDNSCIIKLLVNNTTEDIIHEEFKNRRADVEVYARKDDALNPPRERAVMMVIDINTRITGRVNKHLGNYLIRGELMGEGRHGFPDFPSEIMDLDGYTIFLIYNPSKIFSMYLSNVFFCTSSYPL